MKKKEIFKKCILITSLVSAVLASPMYGIAAPREMPDGQIFDAEYYAASNPDVTAALGTDEALLYQHYLLFGKAEGRKPYATGDTVTQQADSLSAAQKAAMAPAYNCAKTAANALALTQIYDPDGYYILQNDSMETMEFWLFGSGMLAGELDTCVHETFHGYTFNRALRNTQAIYIGDSQTIYVPYTPVFATQEWSVSLPSELRTFRYNTYVAAGASASANSYGVYGLLNEFAAYGWGLNNQICLYDYYAAQPFSMDVWADYVTSCENDFTAFCEFRFYILGYLDYAQTAHPEIWSAIMSNQDFINAYCVTERRFEKNIASYQASKDRIIALGAQNGRRVCFQGSMFYVGNTGRGISSTGRDQLLAQINSAPLKAQEQYMFSLCTVPVMQAQVIVP